MALRSFCRNAHRRLTAQGLLPPIARQLNLCSAAPVVAAPLWRHLCASDPLKGKKIVAFRFGCHIAMHLHESRLSLASISIFTVTCK